MFVLVFVCFLLSAAFRGCLTPDGFLIDVLSSVHPAEWLSGFLLPAVTFRNSPVPVF